MKKSLVLATALAVFATAPAANAGAIANSFKNMVKPLRGNGFLSALQGAGKTLQGLFKGGVKKATDVLNGFKNKIFGGFGHIVQRLKGMGGNLLNQVKGYATQFATNLKKNLSGLVGQGLKLGKGLFSKIQEAIAAAGGKAQAFMLSALQKVSGKVQNLFGFHSKLQDFFKSGLSKIRDLAAGAVKKLKLPKIKGMGFKDIFAKIRGVLGKKK